MTAASIGAAKGGGYARYLESKTIEPERGDYYLTPDGEPTQAPGRWLADARTRSRGSAIEGAGGRGPRLHRADGRPHPRTGRWLRRAGADGGRGGGIDVTFSAPKSVSAVWALADRGSAGEIEAAHAAAVERDDRSSHASTVPTVRRRYDGQVVEEHAKDLIAAEYRHTTARGVLESDAPDPQLHSHVVITSAVREDGRIVAVASRPIFRSARELGAYYRSALAHELQQRGLRDRAGHRQTRPLLRDRRRAARPAGRLLRPQPRGRLSRRALPRTVRAARPSAASCAALKLENRSAKKLATRTDLQQAWNETAARFDFTAQQPGRRSVADTPPVVQAPLEDRVERAPDRARTPSSSPASCAPSCWSSPPASCPHDEALDRTRAMIRDRRVLTLEGGRMTTLAVRAQEQAIERRFTALAKPAGRDVASIQARALAGDSSPSASAAPQRRAAPRAAGHSPAPSAPRSSSAPPAPARAS